LAFLACFAVQAAAQHALEIIPLRHRTVDQVLPALRALLEPGGTLSGDRGQLIVRTSPGNLAQLKQALAAIDRPLRRLQISVRFDDAAESSSQGIEAGGRVSNRGARVELQGRNDRSHATERVDQRIQVLEGGRALIMTGQSTPLPGAIWETGSGFEAVPRLSGDTVLVDIAPQKESREAQ
jgi:type II secretory pathway component GspD/PulD (secretin)